MKTATQDKPSDGEVIDELRRLSEELAEESEFLRQENKLLRQELAALRAGIFGRKRESIDPNQLSLFELSDSAEESEPKPESIIVERHARKKKPGHGRAPFPSHLPREVIEHDVPEADRFCPDCGDAMSPMGEDVCERGHYIPAKFLVRQHHKKKYGCPKGHAVITGEAPAAIVDRCKYEPSVYAHIATSKYCDHTPLHRLSGIFKRHGIDLPKTTMWDMLVRLDEILAQPLLKVMREELLKSSYLYADETPITCRYGAKVKGTFTGYFWLYRDEDRVVCDFTLSRARDGPSTFLADWDFGGTLVIDGYSGYDEIVALKELVRAGCWAHARRKVLNAQKQGAKVDELMALIQLLFRIERRLKNHAQRKSLSRDELWMLRFRIRRDCYGKLFAKIRSEVDRLWDQRSTTPKSLLGKSLTYIDNQWGALTACRADGRIEIHNNDTERAIRHIAIGRKNWNVAGSPKGGQVAARLFSLVLSCKVMGVDPYAWISWVLERLDTARANEISALTPWAWAKKNDVPLLLAGNDANPQTI